MALLNSPDPSSLIVGMPLPKTFSAEASPPTLVDLLTLQTPVQDSVLSYLEIRDMIALSKTAKAIKNSYKVVEKIQFNINKELSLFFDSPNAFRSLQAEHDILIYGPTAYNFVARHLVEPDMWNPLALGNLFGSPRIRERRGSLQEPESSGKHILCCGRRISPLTFFSDNIHEAPKVYGR